MKDLKYYRENAEENYLTTPISVLRYIGMVEQRVNLLKAIIFFLLFLLFLCGNLIINK